MREPPPWTSGNLRDIFELVELGFDYHQSGVYRSDVGGDFRYGEQQNPVTKSSSYFSLSKNFFLSFPSVAHRGFPILPPP